LEIRVSLITVAKPHAKKRLTTMGASQPSARAETGAPAMFGIGAFTKGLRDLARRGDGG